MARSNVKALPALLAAIVAITGAAFSQQQKPPALAPATIARALETQLTTLEKQLVPAAEAMPANKYSFVPEGKPFEGSRSFALEVRHIAAANFAIFSEIVGQAPPRGVSFGGATNGPDDLVTKEQIVAFLKDSFAFAHKSVATITDKNALTAIDDPNLPFKQPYFNNRLALASFACTHASDHYGQMVVYLRMNGVTPPASKGQPPANPAK
jgi:uncharacterized damage-inducible protein DinB